MVQGSDHDFFFFFIVERYVSDQFHAVNTEFTFIDIQIHKGYAVKQKSGGL